jgi:hypothetical protein
MAIRTTKSRTTHRPGTAVRDGLGVLNGLVAAFFSVALQSAGLVITGAGSTLAKVGTAFRYTAIPSGNLEASPVLGLVAAATNVAAFVGSVTNGKFNVFVHTVADDGTGVQTMRTYMGTEGATRAAVLFPAIPANEVPFGMTEIHPTGAGNFVGGTTALDDAGVVPNASFVSLTEQMGAMLAAVKKIGNESGVTLT